MPFLQNSFLFKENKKVYGGGEEADHPQDDGAELDQPPLPEFFLVTDELVLKDFVQVISLGETNLLEIFLIIIHHIILMMQSMPNYPIIMHTLCKKG